MHLFIDLKIYISVLFLQAYVYKLEYQHKNSSYAYTDPAYRPVLCGDSPDDHNHNGYDWYDAYYRFEIHGDPSLKFDYVDIIVYTKGDFNGFGTGGMYEGLNGQKNEKTN